MTVSLEDLDTTAIHVVRRLLAGERVSAKSFRELANLKAVRDELMRRGFVYERGSNFELTALGKALSGAIRQRDAEADVEKTKRLAQARADAAAKKIAPEIFAALVELVEASDAEELYDPKVEGHSEAVDRSTAAYARAEELIAAVRAASEKRK